jgi:WD40 repeat protein
MTKVERTCSRCGLVFVSDKLDGLCPSCLLTNTLDVEDRNDERAFWEEETPASNLEHSFSHFEILEELGRGGMGTVYRARDHVTERIIALKVLQAHHLNEPDLVQRFRSEVRAVTSLDHRHILPIHEVGEYNGIPFFSMKLASGGSLAQHLGDYLRNPRKAAQLLAKIARGVQHAHEHGILHRDLKPGNILLDDAGEPYVCDFGLAKWLEDDRRLTLTSAVLGTPHYIAPEQASGKGVLTIAADIYSLGAILYELLTGRPPFVGETVLDTLRQASECTPAKPSSIVNHTPRDLETICLKALEREPAARYRTAAALADDLENWLAGRPIRARPVSAAEQLWRWARRNPLPAALGIILLIALTTLAIGSTAAAVKIDRARNRAVAAEKEAREQLYGALLAQARASRLTDQAGHRIEALAAIQKAAAIRPSLELRNEAIAALTLVDLKVAKTLKVRGNENQRLAFDAALATVAVAAENGDIAIIDLTDGRIQKTLTGTGKPILSLIHSGSRYVAARCADDAVYVYECATGRQVGQYPGHRIPRKLSYTASDCVFSPDEAQLALGSPEGIEVIEVATGKVVARLKTNQPEQSAFSADGRRLAFGNPNEKTVNIWSPANQNPVTTLNLPAEPSTFAWSDDDQMLAVGCADYSIQVFHVSDYQRIGSLQGHRQAVSKIAFNHRGDMLVSNSIDRTLRLWDLRTMSQLVEQTGYQSESAIGFSLDDQTIGTTDNKSSALLVELVGLRRVCTAFAPPSTKEELVVGSTLDYSPDSRLLALASTTSVRIFDARRGLHLLTLPINTPTQTTVRFLSDGKTLAVLSRRTGLTLHHFIYTDGNFKLTASDNAAQCLSYVFASAPDDFSPYLCMTSEKEAQGVVWDITTAQPVCTIGVSPRIEDMAISPNRKWLVTSFVDHSAQIWTFPSGNKVVELAGGHLGSVSISPSGRWLGVTGSGADHLLWDTENWFKGPALPPEVEEKTGAFAFSYDEKYLAARMRDQTALVSLPEGALLAKLEQRIQPNLYSQLRFSPDGAQLASQGMDNSLLLWDLAELQNELRKLNLHW